MTKIFMFAASLQKNSLNKKLIQLSANYITKLGHHVDVADFSEFDMPLYNADIQNTQGIPETAMQFVERMHKSDGTIISIPEYNYSVPGTFKNMVDWISRISPMPWRNQCIQLLSASPSLVGGHRGLWAARIPLEGCGAFVVPDMFSLASAHEAFESENKLVNEQLQNNLHKMLDRFIDVVHKLK